ncbi:hypothetical protein DWF00_24555 [Bosea caraganae]|uniref:DUF3035 domain-containing protein n=1 Tax=Bosea caraganae TaxID=2763117 RepID=A0A370L4Q4_9HYPH|nr:hypothetical protein [Bosea caraganae]RDJ22381.1 hypothetical protein DWF00_24555 [Bosea caraganae]RDJ23685.1 hypothetical protein DWE98_16200 [Bosea caraganae]
MAYRNRIPQLVVAGGLLLAASPAFAQEGMLFQRLMQGVMGNSEDNIDYRQRPPLVVPPSSALPRPQDPASTRNAAWPNDPDVAARREAARNSLIPTENEKYRNNPMLSQQELRRGRTLQQQSAGNITTEELNNYNNQIAPIRIGRDLASQRNQDDLSKLTYGSEPARQLLTEPPTGYRRPVGSAPLGPGQSGPVEDRQAVGQLEFVTGQKPPSQ